MEKSQEKKRRVERQRWRVLEWLIPVGFWINRRLPFWGAKSHKPAPATAIGRRVPAHNKRAALASGAASADGLQDFSSGRHALQGR